MAAAKYVSLTRYAGTVQLLFDQNSRVDISVDDAHNLLNDLQRMLAPPPGRLRGTEIYGGRTDG